MGKSGTFHAEHDKSVEKAFTEEESYIYEMQNRYRPIFMKCRTDKEYLRKCAITLILMQMANAGPY